MKNIIFTFGSSTQTLDGKLKNHNYDYWASMQRIWSSIRLVMSHAE